MLKGTRGARVKYRSVGTGSGFKGSSEASDRFADSTLLLAAGVSVFGFFYGTFAADDNGEELVFPVGDCFDRLDECRICICSNFFGQTAKETGSRAGVKAYKGLARKAEAASAKANHTSDTVCSMDSRRAGGVEPTKLGRRSFAFDGISKGTAVCDNEGTGRRGDSFLSGLKDGRKL